MKRDQIKNLALDSIEDFPVEVKAEFQGVKITVRELISLQENNLLQLEKISESKLVLLNSENQAIAEGELVVLEDKFALLVRKVLINNQETTQSQSE